MKLFKYNSHYVCHALSSAIAVPALVAQPVLAQQVQVSAVEVKPTDRGLEVVLTTPDGKVPQVFTSSYRNTLVANILNAQLALPQAKVFRQVNPAPGIAVVSVTPQGANSIRVTVIGSSDVPTAKVVTSKGALVFSLTAPADTTAQKPSPTPETPSQPAQPTNPDTQPSPETPIEPTAPADEAAQPEAGEDEEIEIVVTGEQEEGYSVPNASTATRTDTPLRDIPQSIQVIPQQVLEDQQVVELNEALRNVSGVTFSGTSYGFTYNFNIRGFENAPTLRDGFRQFENTGVPETTNLERVEVLKGPASILYGEIQPGGVINLVTKKPLSQPFYEAEVQIGNYGFFRPRIDISGPLDSEEKVLYRLNAAYQSADSFLNYDTEIQRYFVAPTLTWKISDRTDLTVALEYTDDERPTEFGLFAVGDRIVDIPYDRIIGQPDDKAESNQFRVGYDLEHRFNDNWTLRNAFRYIYSDFLLEGYYAGSFDETTGILGREYATSTQTARDYSLQTNIVGKFATGSIGHTLLFGVDLSRNDRDNDDRFDFSFSPLDIFDPDYEVTVRPDRDDVPSFGAQETRTDRLGIYLQDQIALADNLKLLAGLRYDTVDQEQTTEASDFGSAAETERNNDALTPRVGIVYQPIQELSLFTSYSRSFTPNTDTTVSGEFLEPERGEGWEIGAKAELLGGRLFVTLSYFDITKQNVATSDPNFFGFSIASGKQKSQGFEFDMSGEILPGWNIIAAYAYTDAEVREDNDTTLVGNRLFNVPKHSASLWTTYEIQTGSLQGLGFGVGFNYVGEREGDLDNSFRVDSYFLTNAAIFYRRNNWRFALNLKNIFDVDYIEAVENSRFFSNSPGDPFTVIGSVSVEF